MDNIFEFTKKLINEVTEKTKNAKVGDVIEIKGTKLIIDAKFEPSGQRCLYCKDCFFYNYDWFCQSVMCLPSERNDSEYIFIREVRGS